jgi:putative ABC transport system permease protein
MQDLRYAFRALLRNPVLTCVALISVALGIGANTAIFSVMNALMLRPLPVRNPEQLVSVYTISPEKADSKNPISLAMYEEIERRETSLGQVFAWNGGGLNSFEADGQYFAGATSQVSGNYFSALGIGPLLGRLIEPQDVALRVGTSAQVAVLSYRCWQSRFHGDAAVVGKTIRLNDQALTVIGVTPKWFGGLMIDSGEDVIIPFGLTGEGLRDKRRLGIYGYGRLKPGVSVAQARAQFKALWPSIQAATEPEGYTGASRDRFYARKADLESASRGQANLRDRLSKPLVVLMGLAGVVLLIACVNLANLMLSRAAGRRHELAVRAALGAGGRRLTMQLLTESMMLSFGGAVLGFVVAIWTSRLLLSTMWTGAVAMAVNPSPDWRVLAFTIGVALLTGLLVGLAPAWGVSRTDPAEALRQNTRSVHGASLFSRALVSGQVALSTVMVIAAALFVHSLQNMRTVDLGFRRDGILVMQLFAQPGRQVTSDLVTYYREMIQRVSAIPGVAEASFSAMGPVNRVEFPASVRVSGSEDAPELALPEQVGPGFFHMMGMHLLAGREFDWRDDEKAPPVTIISESLARLLFAGQDPLGQTIDLYPGVYQIRMKVVGVVNSASLWRIQSRAPAALYRPLPQAGPMSAMLDIRMNGNTATVAAGARKVVEGMGHEYPLYTQTLEERMNRMTVDERMLAWLAAFFGGLAMLLAAIGLYGLMAYSVARRTPEIGVRMALGAERGDVTRLVLREVGLLVGTGVVVGIPVALWGSRFIAGMLFGVGGTDAGTVMVATGILVAVALGAGYLTARQAAGIDPMTALRVE